MMRYRQMVLALIKNTQIMAVKYMKKVGIHVIYVERCRVLKIFPTFIAGHGAKDGS